MKYSFTMSYDFEVLSSYDVFSKSNNILKGVIEKLPVQRALVFYDNSLDLSSSFSKKIAEWFSCKNINLAAMPIPVVSGEAIKNSIDVLDVVGKAIYENKLCRHSCVIVIGGGAVLDAVGFAASIAHRGINCIRLPTTVLSQNDGGMGVKNGINRFDSKNFYGTFTPPYAIINDSKFLETLPDREWRSGIAEAFKVAIIKDAKFLSWLMENTIDLADRNQEKMEYLISKCKDLHLDHICNSGDPYEKGSSRPLDFGHWAAHKLESLSFNELSHGEAVAIGIAIDCLYAAKIKRLSDSVLRLIISALLECGLELYHPILDLLNQDGKRKILVGLEEFREHLGGELTIAMPNGAGDRMDINEYSEEILEQVLGELKELGKKKNRTPVFSGS